MFLFAQRIKLPLGKKKEWNISAYFNTAIFLHKKCDIHNKLSKEDFSSLCFAISPEEEVGKSCRMGGIQKHLISTNVDQKSLESEFLIAICRPTLTNGNRKNCF